MKKTIDGNWEVRRPGTPGFVPVSSHETIGSVAIRNRRFKFTSFVKPKCSGWSKRGILTGHGT